MWTRIFAEVIFTSFARGGRSKDLRQGMEMEEDQLNQPRGT